MACGWCRSVVAAVAVVVRSSGDAELVTLTVVFSVVGLTGDKVAAAGVRVEDGGAAAVVVPSVVVSSAAVVDAVVVVSAVSWD